MKTQKHNLTVRWMESPMVRIALHLICAARDHKFRWHTAGICRELHLDIDLTRSKPSSATQMP